MLLRFTPFLWLFIAMSSGIVFADIFNPEIYFSIGISVLLLVIFISAQLFRTGAGSVFGRVTFIFPLLLFFQLGQLLYLATLPGNDPMSVENNYLPGDKIMGEITAISNTSGVYKKCEVEVISLVRYQDTVPARGKVLMFLEDTLNALERKDVCLVRAELSAITNNHNPGEFDSREFWKHKSIYRSAFVTEGNYVVAGRSRQEFMDWFLDLRDVFSSILDKYMEGDENAVAKGLILGDRSSIDSEITRKFGNTGAMHVLAVSGLHVAILVQILTACLGLFSRWITKNQALIIALLIVWIYSALTGLSASVVRSALMFTILAGSTLWGRNYNGFNSLALSAVLILIWNPHFLYDIGFQLSYLAMAGIFLFNRPLSKLFYTKVKWIQAAYEGTMVGIAAQIMTVPLTLYYFHQFPNYFVLTNLGLMVFSFLVLALGIALFATVWLTPLAKLFALLLTFSMFLMLWIIDFVDSLPGAVSSGFVPEIWEVILLFGIILVFFATFMKQQIRLMTASLAVCSIWVVFLVNDRFKRMETHEICFFQAKEPTFIVKRGNSSFCFFANRQQRNQKARYLAEAYQKVFPGDLHYFEISSNARTDVRLGNDSISIARVKGGYTIDLKESAYFYATSDAFDHAGRKVIYAPWLSGGKTRYQLSRGAIVFRM